MLDSFDLMFNIFPFVSVNMEFYGKGSDCGLLIEGSTDPFIVLGTRPLLFTAKFSCVF